MNTESVRARILPAVEQIIKEVVRQAATADAPPTLYDLEAQTQAALPHIGQAVLEATGSGTRHRSGRTGTTLFVWTGPTLSGPSPPVDRAHQRGRHSVKRASPLSVPKLWDHQFPTR
jgi:hypothetical protein